jgi:hypothetical protein
MNHVDHIDDLDLDEGLMPDRIKALPEALAKAVSDNPFQYALMLRDGTIIEFEGATPPSAGWILLDRPKIVNRGYDACLERGMEVRLQEIVWVADAPHGS